MWKIINLDLLVFLSAVGQNLSMTEFEKKSAYQRAGEKINALLSGEQDMIARMASVSSILAGEFDTFFWTGFYRMLDGELVIGPYQGTPGCLRISLDRGVCGAAVTQGQTMVVADVHEYPGHIACDARSRSEIVVPVWDASGMLIAVLDVDSEKIGTFNEIDRVCLEAIVTDVFGSASTLSQHLA
ncbi:MAG: GAF domain-containing protein [Akkermansiaceae bacterium]